MIFLVVFLILLFFSALVLFLIFPSVRRHDELGFLDGKYIAHRGLHDINNQIPENSLAAFRAAADSGFAIEIDIRLTADGEIVVFHDDSLERMCGIKEKVSKLSLEELSKARLNGTDSKIPTLAQCLKTVAGRVPLLIEFKCSISDYADLCSKANGLLSQYKGRYYVQSFCPQVLWWYRRNRKDVFRGQLASGFKGAKFSKKFLGLMLLNFISRPDFISYHFKDSKNIGFRLCRSLGAFPIGWTFHSQDEVDAHSAEFKTFIFENFIPR